MNDVRDILDINDPDGGGGSSAIASSSNTGSPMMSSSGTSRKFVKKNEPPKRPEGMHRELYALLVADGGKGMELAPLLPSDVHQGGYQKRAKLGARHVRAWKWTGFTNPARSDGAVFYHWKRVLDENKEYPFAKFNKEIPIPQYSEQEYANNLEKEGWTKQETDHLFDLARRFDLRFTVMKDRYEKRYPSRSIEDIKERYYTVTGILTKLRAEPGHGHEAKIFVYDTDHERRRKEQLNKLWSKTPEQIEEEEFLKSEIKKIEARKREREKKTQDLQKLITAADGGGINQTPEMMKKMQLEGMKRSGLSAKKKSGKSPGNPRFLQPNPDTSFCGIKWPDHKTPGISIRSARLKLPGTVGQKKVKAIEAFLNDEQVAPIRVPTEDICQQFNELRSDIVLHYELKQALHLCSHEMHSLKHQIEASKPGVEAKIPDLLESIPIERGEQLGDQSGIILPKKRKAAIEQGNILKKLKNKM